MPTPSTGRWIARSAIIAVAAVVATTITFLAAESIIDGDIVIPSTPGGDETQVLNIGLVIGATFVAAVVAAALAWVLQRRTAHPDRLFAVITLVGTAVSMGGPLLGSIPTSNKFALVLMHLVAALVIIGGLVVALRWARTEQRTGRP